MRVNDYELLSAYIDGELTEAERAALESRLQNEPQLQRELQSLQQTTTLLRQLPELKAPRDFTLDATEKHSARVLPFTLTATFSALSTAAAVLLVAFGGYFLLQADSMELSADLRERQAAQSAAPSEVALAPTGTPAPTQPALLPTPSPEIAAMEAPFAQSAPAESDGGTAGTLAEESGQEPGADDAAADETLGQTENEAAADQMVIPPPTFRDEGEFFGRGAMPTMAAPGIAFPPLPATAGAEQSMTGEANLQAASPELPSSAVTQDNRENAAATDMADLDNEQAEQVAQAPSAEPQAAATVVETDNRALIGLALAAAGGIMLVVAVITTLLRRRSLNKWA